MIRSITARARRAVAVAASLSLASLAVVGGTVAAAGPATANSAALVTCVGQETATYTPGLTLTTPRDVHYTATIDYGTCPTSDGVTSAVYHEAGFLEDATCVAVPSTSTATITWRNGSTVVGTSTVQVTGVELNAVGAVQLYTSLGTVTSGRYQGQTVNIVVALLVDLDNPTPCLTTTGLTNLGGLATLTIL